MDRIKKGLGRGLSSLIGETKVVPQKNHLSIRDLVPNKYQPRKNFDEASLEDLTNSIKERGMIQPIIVRISNDDKSKYETIAGERRWLAAQRAGLHDVPVVVTEADDLKSLEFAFLFWLELAFFSVVLLGLVPEQFILSSKRKIKANNSLYFFN